MKLYNIIRNGLYTDILDQTNVLIAGMQGSGKSVLESGIIYNLITHSPANYKLVLIDPKRVELGRYKHLPHVMSYSQNIQDIKRALQAVEMEMDKRYKYMDKKNLQTFEGSHIYILIDEYRDIVNLGRKEVTSIIDRLMYLGRASRIHVIACTQYVAGVIDTKIRANFDCVIGLHVRTVKESQIIIGAGGCETLPRYGYCFMLSPANLKLRKVRYYTNEEITAIVDQWKPPKKSLFKLFR